MALLVFVPPVLANPARQPIKVIVAAMYENGEVRGDAPGEIQFWVERLHLDRQLPFPMGESDLYLNDTGVMAVVLGGGIPNATASIMALGLDPRFDLSKTYWLIAGVAGGDPADMSLGSAAWARHVVDGDLLYEIDAREIPEHWPYGLIPLGAKEPAERPEDIYTGWTLDTISFSLNSALVDWAYSITRDLKLPDSAGIATHRKLYEGYPLAQQAPFVTLGDTLSSSTYWHGKLLNRWANDWLKLYAGEDANFMTANMEDSGTMTALYRLARTNLVDTDRVLILRTASNYTLPPPGKTAAWSRTVPYPDNGVPALESAFLVGNTVVQALLAGWSRYETESPGVD
ncbi:MAG: purine nucleoside permease [Gammaproteobacteria bacterium]|nr:purine nucleoside permease [Gammaproteobacteria bacterium]